MPKVDGGHAAPVSPPQISSSAVSQSEFSSGFRCIVGDSRVQVEPSIGSFGDGRNYLGSVILSGEPGSAWGLGCFSDPSITRGKEKDTGVGTGVVKKRNSKKIKKFCFVLFVLFFEDLPE